MFYPRWHYFIVCSGCVVNPLLVLQRRLLRALLAHPNAHLWPKLKLSVFHILILVKDLIVFLYNKLGISVFIIFHIFNWG